MTLGQAVLIAFGASIITLAALTIAVIKIPAIWGRISAWIDHRMDTAHARHHAAMRSTLTEADNARLDAANRSRALDTEYRQLVLDEHNKP